MILNRLLDGVVSTGTPWYQPYVEYAQQNGIINKTISTAYTEPISRALFAQLISNALPDDALPVLNELTAEIPDVPTGSPYSDALDPLMDAGMIYDSDTIPILLMSMNYVAYANSEHASAIYRLYRAGILTGNDSYGTFTPAATIRRSAVAAVISRVVEPDQRQKFTLTLTPSAANPELVPLDKLANLSSLRKNASDEEMMQAYEAARKIVEPLVHLRKEAQICAVTFALRSITDRKITYSMTEAHYNDPYGFFVLNTASCAGCVRATGLCLNMLGIEYEHVNAEQNTHQWARIGVDGRYWISDAYGMFCGLEEEPYKHPEGL